MTSDLPENAAANDYPDPGLAEGHGDAEEREAALESMPEGTAETADQVDREALDIEQSPDEEVDEDI